MRAGRRQLLRLFAAWASVALVAAGCGGTRGHDLLDGRYAFTATEVLTDPCGLLPATGLWGGQLDLVGNWVRLDYDLLSIGMVGHFRSKVEEFYADGTVEEVTLATAAAASCPVDQVQVHLNAVVVDPNRFDGALSVRSYASAQEACECELSVTYRADRQ